VRCRYAMACRNSLSQRVPTPCFGRKESQFEPNFSPSMFEVSA
jgi:hypothetical protein